ncbi:GAP family protein [Pseudactinotalea suaedae]|uniref:GAP family protein n=1 Tax=Pseudactinotalea suaedae TaxID=1524924 RepID=UPI0012E0F262|nr:GAP family protein [Pseudactinotalea suaedae]
MTELLAPLAALALVDSTSFGTLLIPLWLMLAPGRLRAHRVLIFLGTVAAYYFVLGVALLAGATQVAGALGGFLETPAASWIQLALGVGLFLLSFMLDPKKPATTTAAEGGTAQVPTAQASVPAGASSAVGGSTAVVSSETTSPPRPGRVARWRARAMGAEGGGSLVALVGLALGAAGIETASMLPYLSAIGLLTASEVTLASGVTVLAGYCLVMILPALVLLAFRVLAYQWVRGPLERLEAWMSRSAASMTSWIVGILGVLLTLDALGRVGIPGVTGLG